MDYAKIKSLNAMNSSFVAEVGMKRAKKISKKGIKRLRRTIEKREAKKIIREEVGE